VLPVASLKEESNWNPENWNLVEDLDLESSIPDESLKLSKQEMLWINAWDDFVRIIREATEGKRLPGFPIWADAFVEQKSLQIPPGTPKWKSDFLVKNSKLYTDHAALIDSWAERWGVFSEAFPSSRRKLEWQAQDAVSLWDTVMHFRPSGIRAKRPTYVPALVAITQTSIVGPLKRRLSPREAARLQGVPEWFDFGAQTNAKTYKQLGNGVNIGVVWQILKRHASRDGHLMSDTAPSLLNALNSAPDSPDLILANLANHRPG
jgi:DNA (cytosine-5)-methyltransferase 1